MRGIRVWYWKRGYRETQVDTAGVPRGHTAVGVTFRIDEGPPTLVSKIVVKQATPLLAQRDINRSMSLAENQAQHLIRLDTTRVFLQAQLFDQGYADAVVATAIVIDTVTHTAAVTFPLDPQSTTPVTAIVIHANAALSAPVL